MTSIVIVRDILKANAPVVAAVAGRIWPVEPPQASGEPSIVIHSVSESDERGLQGSCRYPVSQCIVDSLAASYTDADALGETVKAALRDYRGTVGLFAVDDVAVDDLDFFDRGDRGNVWRRRIGFRVRYRAT